MNISSTRCKLPNGLPLCHCVELRVFITYDIISRVMLKSQHTIIAAMKKLKIMIPACPHLFASSGRKWQVAQKMTCSCPHFPNSITQHRTALVRTCCVGSSRCIYEILNGLPFSNCWLVSTAAGVYSVAVLEKCRFRMSGLERMPSKTAL